MVRYNYYLFAISGSFLSSVYYTHSFFSLFAGSYGFRIQFKSVATQTTSFPFLSCHPFLGFLSSLLLLAMKQVSSSVQVFIF